MKIYEFEFTIEEIKELVNAISNLRRRKRDYICLLLYFSTELLVDWYNDINKVFTPVLVRGGIRKLTDAERHALFEFSNKIAYIPIVDNLSSHFEILKKDYDNGILVDLNGDEKKIRDIFAINHDLLRFSDEGSQQKTDWIKKFCDDENWDVILREVPRWMNNLQQTVIRANRARIKLNLNCREDELRNILKQSKDKK